MISNSIGWNEIKQIVQIIKIEIFDKIKQLREKINSNYQHKNEVL